MSGLYISVLATKFLGFFGHSTVFGETYFAKVDAAEGCTNMQVRKLIQFDIPFNTTDLVTRCVRDCVIHDYMFRFNEAILKTMPDTLYFVVMILTVLSDFSLVAL
jgi:hypothetical protein